MTVHKLNNMHTYKVLYTHPDTALANCCWGGVGVGVLRCEGVRWPGVSAPGCTNSGAGGPIVPGVCPP